MAKVRSLKSAPVRQTRSALDLESVLTSWRWRGRAMERYSREAAAASVSEGLRRDMCWAERAKMEYSMASLVKAKRGMRASFQIAGSGGEPASRV